MVYRFSIYFREVSKKKEKEKRKVHAWTIDGFHTDSLNLARFLVSFNLFMVFVRLSQNGIAWLYRASFPGNFVIFTEEPPEVFYIKKCSLKILQNLQESTSVKVSFLKKLPQACNFKKEALAQVFSREFCQIFRTISDAYLGSCQISKMEFFFTKIVDFSKSRYSLNYFHHRCLTVSQIRLWSIVKNMY